MATSNFETMERFDLFAANSPVCKVCPECGLTMGAEDSVCDECGASLEGVDATYDEVMDYENVREVEAAMAKLNDTYRFHELSVKGGHYSGTQFYVTEKFEGFDNMEDMDNEDAQYHFGMCRSALLRKYNAEVRRVSRDMEKLAAEHGYMKLLLVARFSNGETMFAPAENKRAQLRAAVA